MVNGLDQLPVGEMLAQVIQVPLLRVSRTGGQEVGEPEDRPLFC